MCPIERSGQQRKSDNAIARAIRMPAQPCASRSIRVTMIMQSHGNSLHGISPNLSCVNLKYRHMLLQFFSRIAFPANFLAVTSLGRYNIGVELKRRLHHDEYMRALSRMTPSQRAMKAFELSEQAKQLFIHGLRKRFPNLPEEQFHALLLDRLALCHNRNY
jgi:hypothetical protein